MNSLPFSSLEEHSPHLKLICKEVGLLGFTTELK